MLIQTLNSWALVEQVSQERADQQKGVSAVNRDELIRVEAESRLNCINSEQDLPLEKGTAAG